MKTHLTMKSDNAKIGPIPVSTTSAESCPAACPFNNGGGCYATYGPLMIHWKAVTAGTRGMEWDEFCEAIAALPEGQLWRHNQAGDLPGASNRIDRAKLRRLVDANAGKRGFTYTHKPLTPHNVKAIEDANARGFTVNVSANSAAEAAAVKRTHPALPVACVLPEGHADKVTTVDGVRIVQCPATCRETTCAECRLCQRTDRDFVIGFPAHGSGKRKVSAVAGRVALATV